MMLIDIYQDEQTLKAATGLLYQLLAERPPEANISHHKMPTPEEHERYLRARPHRCWWMIENAQGNWVGSAYVTHQNEIGVFILKAERAKGYGSKAVRTILKNLEPLPADPGRRGGRFIANVAPNNGPSNLLFQKLGWRVVQVTYAQD